MLAIIGFLLPPSNMLAVIGFLLSSSKYVARNLCMLIDPDYPSSACWQVKQMLAVAEAASEAEGGIAAGSNGCDEIIEAVPYLINPSQLSSSLVFLQRFFPGQDPLEDPLEGNDPGA
eukprot:gene29559-5909_t